MMRSPVDAVFVLLRDAPAVASIVGPRIFKLFLQQDTAPPNVIVRTVTGRNTTDLAAGQAQSEYRVSVECRAASVAATDTLGKAVYEALHGYQGIIGTHQIDRILHVAEVFVPNDDLKLFRRILDFYVYYR